MNNFVLKWPGTSNMAACPRVFSWGFICFVLVSVSKGSGFLLSLQTKRALYLTKTPFQCNLHANLMPLYMHVWWEHFKNLTFTYFTMKQKFYEPLFGDWIFFIWRLKTIFQWPLGTCIKKLISDPLAQLFSTTAFCLRV